MITSNSTFTEIEAQKALDEQNIKDFLLKKMERDGRKLKRIFKTKTYYTPLQPATYHLEKPLCFDPFGQTGFTHFGHNMIDPLKSW